MERKVRTSDGPPTGWVSVNGELEPASQVAAYAARRQVVKGLCRAKGCARRLELDPTELCGLGQALLTMDQVKRLYRCGRLDGCAIDFHNEPPQHSLELRDFIGRPNVRIRLRCRGNGCRFFRVWIPEQMIAGLQRVGKGNENTQIEKLGSLMSAGCPVCKKVNWTADVLWANTDTMGWRATGERVFAEMERGDVV